MVLVEAVGENGALVALVAAGGGGGPGARNRKHHEEEAFEAQHDYPLIVRKKRSWGSARDLWSTKLERDEEEEEKGRQEDTDGTKAFSRRHSRATAVRSR